MGMQAATVDVLVKKANFEPIVAIAVAEAIDMAITDAQPVTVPILEAKLTSLKSEIDGKFASLESRIDGKFTSFRADMDVKFAAVDIKFAKLKNDLIIWILVITLGSNYLPQIVGTLGKAISALFK